MAYCVGMTRRKKMTPCTERGWKEGEVFEVADDSRNNLKAGTIVEFYRDDGTSIPWFLSGKEGFIGNAQGFEEKDGLYQVCLKLKDIERIWPPELSKDVTFTCDETGKKTTLSRESAKAMNLL